jgi:hypothetical protein
MTGKSNTEDKVTAILTNPPLQKTFLPWERYIMLKESMHEFLSYCKIATNFANSCFV